MEQAKRIPYGVSNFVDIVERRMSEEDYNKLIAQQWEDAKEQIKGYAMAPRVEALRQGTQLHRIIMQFDGYKLHRLDEV